MDNLRYNVNITIVKFLMNALIITGANEEQRLKKLEELLKKEQISDFDRFSLSPQPLSIGIDQVKGFIRWISLKPYQSVVKAGIIHQAEKMTVQAQNSLLKTLEEPPAHSLIFLLTANSDLLLPTIVSRCQILDLKNKGEKASLANSKELEIDLEIILNGTTDDKFVLAEHVGKGKDETIEWIDNILNLTDQLIKKTWAKNESLKKNEKSLNPQFIATIIEGLNKAKKDIQANINPRFALEILFLSFSS